MSKHYVVKAKTFLGAVDIVKKYTALKQQVFKDDGLALVTTYAIIEMTLDLYPKAKCKKHGDKLTDPNAPLLGKAAILNEFDIIDDKMYGYISVIKDLRNEFAHKLKITDELKKRLMFDKSDSYHKQYIKKSGHKPEGFRERLSYVLSRLLSTGIDALSEPCEVPD